MKLSSTTLIQNLLSVSSLNVRSHHWPNQALSRPKKIHLDLHTWETRLLSHSRKALINPLSKQDRQSKPISTMRVQLEKERFQLSAPKGKLFRIRRKLRKMKTRKANSAILSLIKWLKAHLRQRQVVLLWPSSVQIAERNLLFQMLSFVVVAGIRGRRSDILWSPGIFNVDLIQNY